MGFLAPHEVGSRIQQEVRLLALLQQVLEEEHIQAVQVLLLEE